MEWSSYGERGGGGQQHNVNTVRVIPVDDDPLTEQAPPAAHENHLLLLPQLSIG